LLISKLCPNPVIGFGPAAALVRLPAALQRSHAAGAGDLTIYMTIVINKQVMMTTII
jgi:hypothetical protein